jgi:sucrose-6-phosphate hydrolase SacC (GH32 family)
MDGECLKLTWDSVGSLLTLDRSGLKTSTFNEFFVKPSELEIQETEQLEIRIILDRSIIEIYAMAGKYVMTSQVFPSHSLISLRVNTVCGDRIKDFIHHTLDSIWKSN